MSTLQYLNKNPVPILQQERSSIVTNPFIPNEQKELELAVVQREANSIIQDAYKNNKTSSIQDLTLSQINKNISQSVTSFVDDMFVKPVDIPWRHYIPMMLQKEQRYTYFGVLCLFVAIFIMLAKK
jgi:hypothetical protein